MALKVVKHGVGHSQRVLHTRSLQAGREGRRKKGDLAWRCVLPRSTQLLHHHSPQPQAQLSCGSSTFPHKVVHARPQPAAQQRPARLHVQRRLDHAECAVGPPHHPLVQHVLEQVQRLQREGEGG